MQARVPITQRAFEIARSGSVSNVQDIKRQLQREGYAADSLQGPALFKQLRAAIGTERQRAKPLAISDEAAAPEMPEDVAKHYEGSPR